MFQAINPATGELIGEYPEPDDEEIDARMQQAEEAFSAWRQVPMAERAGRMFRAAEILRTDRAALARLITEEMGKPIASAEAEIEKCAWACEFYATHAATFLAPRDVATDASKSYVRYDPLGVVLAIMPWNFPFWQVFRFAAPALMAGNAAVLKHASNVPGSAMAIESIFHDAEFPEGLFTALLVPAKKALDLIARPEIRAVTITGSDRAGRDVAAAAGRALRKTVLELGGSDPFLVLSDADPVAAARLAAKSRTVNAGQSCIAAKRFIVEAPIAERFEEALAEAMAGLRVGDPMDRQTEVGPLARKDLVDALHDQVTRTVRAGATLRTGGRPLDRRGFDYAPTVLLEVEPGMAAFDEETFGPVAAVVRAEDRQHAVALANRSRFGLGATICTPDLDEAQRLAAEIEAGLVFVNSMVQSDPRLPFGGVKASGYGRELSDVGIREFVNVKTVWVQPPGT